MYKTIFSTSLAISTAIALFACGGGSEHTCGEKSQSFGVAFETQSFNIKLGQATELKSTVTPESCRFDISFSEKGGLPSTAMSLALPLRLERTSFKSSLTPSAATSPSYRKYR